MDTFCEEREEWCEERLFVTTSSFAQMTKVQVRKAPHQTCHVLCISLQPNSPFPPLLCSISIKASFTLHRRTALAFFVCVCVCPCLKWTGEGFNFMKWTRAPGRDCILEMAEKKWWGCYDVFFSFFLFIFCMIIKGKCCSSGQNDARLHKEILLFSNVESQWNQIEVFIFQASSDRRPQTKCMYGNERCFTFFEGLVQCLGKYLGKLLSHLIPSRKANHFSDLLTLDYNTWLKKAPRVDYQFNFIYSQTVKITEAQNSSCFIFFF